MPFFRPCKKCRAGERLNLLLMRSAFKKITASLIIFTASYTLYAQVPAQDSLALVAFYNATGGPQWTNSTNWLQPGKKVSDWFGIGISSAPHRVRDITLFNNNLTGQIPEQIADITFLNNLFLPYNHLTGAIPVAIADLRYLQLLELDENEYSGQIPAFLFQIKDPPASSGTLRQLALAGNNFTSIDYQPAPNYKLGTLFIQDNQLDFSDIEPLIGTGIINFTYAPQQPIYTADNITLHDQAKLTIKSQTDGSDNRYQWMQDNTTIQNITTSIYTMQVTLTDDGRVYTATVKNPLVPNLTLERNPITVHITNDIYFDCNTSSFMLEAGSTDINATYLWSTGATTRTITVTTAGKYGIRIETPNYIAEDTLEVHLPATLSLGPDLDRCENMTTLTSNISDADSYTWQTPNGEIQNQTMITATTSGQYTLTITQDGCTKSDAINVVIGNTTVGTFTITTGATIITEDMTALSTVPITFTNTTGNGEGYTWTFDDLGTAEGDEVTHTYTRPGTYNIKLTGKDSRNCPVTAEKTIVVKDILIANAISTNGDGKNDKWYIEPFLFRAELKIVDRKGRTVFEASPYNDDFTGQGLEEGIYYYDLYLSEVDRRYKGYIHILKH